MSGYVEKALSFGPQSALAGVWVEPVAGAAKADAPTLLIWNTGINHHVGPWRFNVDLTRALARAGFASLRFDASGLGDSESRGDVSTETDRWAADLRDAMGVAQSRRGKSEVVLLGFCSSTDPAHYVALQEPKVVGTIFVEGYAYRSKAFWRRYPLRYLERARWERLAKRTAARLAGKPAPAYVPSMFAREYPPPARFAAELNTLLARGVKLQFTFSGGDSDFNHEAQFDDMLGDATIRPRVDLKFYPEADHTFFRVEDRRRLIEHLVGWMQQSF